MNNYILWMKVVHITFITSWFSGLFYLPRIFVNLAEETELIVISRLLNMAKRLYRFSTLLAVPTITSGILLYFNDMDDNLNHTWMRAKLLLVLLVIWYHYICGKILSRFQKGTNKHHHMWFRIFNEILVLLLVAIIALVIFKPF